MLGSPGVASSLLGQPVLNLGRQLALRGEEGGDWPYWHSLFGIPDDGQETDVSAASAALSWLVDGGTAMEQGAKSWSRNLSRRNPLLKTLHYLLCPQRRRGAPISSVQSVFDQTKNQGMLARLQC